MHTFVCNFIVNTHNHKTNNVNKKYIYIYIIAFPPANAGLDHRAEGSRGNQAAAAGHYI